ncbi:uncharacterized protein LOC109283942 [Alligator mississippiensis]|uniref:uncharacterized protein LOC109283942 n=1 Tax=Alligator mississippiensis TaxID=8496 RepID=UPI002877591C|nr:uncharacterized protein LOC109283942 [Alligator mississippiensis]
MEPGSGICKHFLSPGFQVFQKILSEGQRRSFVQRALAGVLDINMCVSRAALILLYAMLGEAGYLIGDKEEEIPARIMRKLLHEGLQTAAQRAAGPQPAGKLLQHPLPSAAAQGPFCRYRPLSSAPADQGPVKRKMESHGTNTNLLPLVCEELSPLSPKTPGLALALHCAPFPSPPAIARAHFTPCPQPYTPGSVCSSPQGLTGHGNQVSHIQNDCCNDLGI